MVKRLTSFALSLLVALPSVALAADDVDSIMVDSLTVSECSSGSSSVSATLSATYSEGTQHVVVTVDGTVVFGPDTDEPAAIAVGPLVLGSGSHSLVATIYDTSDLDDPVAQQVRNFDVCASTSGDGDSDGDDGPDCCPGKDSDDARGGDEEQVTKQGKVKGTVSKKSSSLAPINSTFRKVYGRNPSFTEWNYWANRYLTDKQHLPALYGAMQWHQLRGHTMGS